MPARPRTYQQASGEIISFVGTLARAPVGHTVESRTGTKADAFSFRQRLYSWRMKVLAGLARPGTKDFDEAAQWLSTALGPRSDWRDWFDLTIFEVVELPHPRMQMPSDSRWIVRARIREPMAGPGIAPAAVSPSTHALLHAAGVRRPANDGEPT